MTKYFKEKTNYFIKTVSYFYVGRLIKENDKFITFDNCSMIPDQGRVNECMSEGLEKASGSEIEVFPKEKEINIQIDSIIEYFQYNFDLPIETK